MNVHRSSSSFSNLKLGLIRRFTRYVSDHQKQNYYDSLGVTPKATQGDIKTAYYKLSKAYHPDLNKGDESAAEKFRNISAAYEVLGNVKSRKVYDRGLLVGSYPYENEGEVDPVPDNYPHAPFYHHRNKPASRKAQTGTTNYNIDEWTRAHYSKTFEKRFEQKNKEYEFREQTANNEKDVRRTLPTLSLIILITVCFLTYGTDANNRKYDTPSKINYKPD